MSELRTDRLLMRYWRPDDREAFAAMNADAEVMRFFPAPLSRAESDELVDRIESRFATLGYGLWALEVLETGAFIGFTGLNPMPEGVPGAGGSEVGWRLSRAAWGHGYATEAARVSVAYGFDRVGLDVVYSMTSLLNEPSRRVMERIGMRPGEEFEHPRVPAGSPVRPHIGYRLEREWWPPQ